MPYGFRVFSGMLGGLLLGSGLVFAASKVAEGSHDLVAGPAVASGIGLSLLVAAFVRRD